MRELYFFVKAGILTFVIVMLLQVKLGNETIEDKANYMIHETRVGAYLEEVAQGGVKALSELYEVVIGEVDSKFSKTFSRKNMPGKRKLFKAFERTQQYVEDSEIDDARDELLREYAEAEVAPSKEAEKN